MVTFPGGKHDPQPELEFVIEVVEGAPICTRLLLARREGRREIRQGDLRAIELDNWIEQIVAAVASLYPEEGGKFLLDPDDADMRRLRSQVRGMQRGAKRRVTHKLLREVADVYAAHAEAGAPTKAVRLTFGTSERTAARWVARAREEGLLE